MKNSMRIKLFSIQLLFVIAFASVSDAGHSENSEKNSNPIPYNTEPDRFPFIEKEKEKPKEGPELERYYFEQWHYPYGAVLAPEIINKVWTDVRSVPNETEVSGDAINTWRMIGPYGSTVLASGAKFTGRVLDIEVGNTAYPLIASASGGLWSYFLTIPITVSDNINSLAAGAFTTHPSDAGTILLGTGEPRVRGGTGLYRSTNSGSSWTKMSMSPEPGGFFKISHQSFFSAIVHAATNEGYYRSSNSGLTWTRYLSGEISDIAINPSSPNTMYAGKWGDGVYKSTNNGLNWMKVTTTGIPTTSVGRVSISIGTSNTNKVYVSIAHNTTDALLGIYLSTNNGTSWSNISTPENIFRSQGWYDNVISVCPTNSNIVLVGGVTLWRSVNSGSTWTEINDDFVHADQHAMEWTSDGSTLYLGNDGGITVSTNQGVSFSTMTNYFPITQYVNFDIGSSNRGVIYGGSQDNGLTGTTDGGTSWIFTKGGDGGGVAIDPFSALFIYATGGVYNGNYSFRRFKSTDKGLTWDTTNIGVDPSSQWYTKMRSDRAASINIYTNSGPYVYESDDEGDTWSKLNSIPFPVNISNLNVSKFVSPNAIIYVSLGSSTTGQRLRVYENGNFFERSSGLPSGERVRGVATHLTNTSTAYALMDNFSDGEKIFKTTNRGINWTNITGNLPDVPLGDLIPHPSNSNNLYLGTEFGCYRTTNAGVSWHRWNNGMPEANIVTELKTIDSTLDNGRFYIAACTYGRSIWVRDISGDDPGNTLSFTALIEGFYNESASTTIRDTLRVYLREGNSPYGIVDSSKAYISNTGTASLTFPLAFNGEEYYIAIRHRNSIETWSAETRSFEDYSLSYNFTTEPEQAFGNNITRVDSSPLRYGIYSGDVNQDDAVDLTDLILISNAANIFATGYIPADVNGDSFADLSDLVITFNNSSNFVVSITP